MDFLNSDIQANALLQNGILVATNKGVVCMSVTDALSSNLNLSVEDLKTVAQQLILQEQTDKSSNSEQSDTPQLFSDTTADSDEQTHHAKMTLIKSDLLESQSVSDSDTNSITTITFNDVKAIATHNQVISPVIIETNKVPAKRRGGWPKGRKRKPELLHLPPKAPATGYNLYLNDIRKQFKDSPLAFHEITKIIGNRWSSLSLEQKQPYLERAEEDKRRYREELRVYRQSGAYQLYLARKRKKKVQNNVLSESDMDATDDIDDEDNEELYCRTCDQWFHNLHNKREHLQGRQHMQAIVGDMRSELGSDYGRKRILNSASSLFDNSLNESSLINSAPSSSAGGSVNDGMTVTECMANLVTVVTRREKEINALNVRLEEAKAAHDALYQQLRMLKERETSLRNDLNKLHNLDKEIEIKLFQLWKVPSLFITTDFSSSLEGSEYLTDE